MAQGQAAQAAKHVGTAPGEIGAAIDSFTGDGLVHAIAQATGHTGDVDGPNVSSAPIAVPDNYTAAAGHTLTVAAPGYLGNDIDADGNPFSSYISSLPANGQLVWNGDGSFSYTPNAGFIGTDSFEYGVYDTSGQNPNATVTFNVINDAAPDAVDDSYGVDAGATLAVAAKGVLSNDTDADSAALTAKLVDDVQHGTLVLNSNGSFSYTPNNGYAGPDSFTYKANDGLIDGDTATVSLTVTAPPPVNSAPTDISLSGAAIAENSANGTVVGSLTASDPDQGDIFSFSLLNDASGRFAISGSSLVVAGVLDYEAATAYDISVRATDSGNASFDKTLTIAVTNVSGVTINGTGADDIINATPRLPDSRSPPVKKTSSAAAAATTLSTVATAPTACTAMPAMTSTSSTTPAMSRSNCTTKASTRYARPTRCNICRRTSRI